MSRQMRFLTGVLAALIFVLSACTAQPVPTTVPTSVTEPTAAEEVSAETGYLLLSPNRTHPVAKAFSALPRTIEVKLHLESSYKKAGGILLGTADSGSTSVELTLQEKGAPCLCYYDGQTGKDTEYLFNEVDVRGEKAIRLTIVREETQLLCYVDGTLQQTLAIEATEADPQAVQLIGGDLRTNNGSYFKGRLYHLALWSEAKTADAVAAFRIEKLDPQDSGLLAAYDFGAGNDRYQDLTNHGYDLPDNLLTVSGEPGIYSAALPEDGFAFDRNSTYATKTGLSGEPYTIAAWLYLPEEESSGILLGSRQKQVIPFLNISITDAGCPAVQYMDENCNDAYAEFKWVHLAPQKWTHLAFSIDSQQKSVSCYLDGSFVGTITTEQKFALETVQTPYALCGDLYSPYASHFTGRMLDLAVFRKSLSAEEIAALYSSGVEKQNDLLAYYPLGDVLQEQDVADASGNGHAMAVTLRFFTNKEPVTDYAYSFAIIGDTQSLTDLDVNRGTDYLSKVYDWLIANKDAKKIRYVFGLGDITQVNSEAQWKHAGAQTTRLDGVIPYSLVRGNHDVGGEANGQSFVPDYFAAYCGTDAYKQQFANGGFYSEENIRNAWCTFEVGKVSYLLLALDVIEDKAVLQWANDVVAAHPDHNVIVTTHIMMGGKNSFVSYKAGMLSGAILWDTLLSKHENIVLAISGHVPTERVYVSQKEGENGNPVTLMLVDPQSLDLDIDGPAGMVAMLYFSEDGRQVQVEYYSTIREQFLLKANQFRFEMAVVGD